MRAILVGLGRIGWRGFGNPNIPTHRSTMESMIDKVTLVGGVDTDDSARYAFQQATNHRVYPSLTTALSDCQPEIVVVATPPDTHRALVEEAAANPGVKGILCEKPMAETISDCRAIIGACLNKVLLIGHQRRYDQNHILLKHFLQSEALGRVLAGKAVFSGGHLNNGTHAADTLRMLIGDHMPFTLQETDSGDMFSVRCICENGDIALSSYGTLHAGYLRFMYDDLLSCIETGDTPRCSGEDGLEAVRLALAAKERDETAA